MVGKGHLVFGTTVLADTLLARHFLLVRGVPAFLSDMAAMARDYVVGPAPSWFPGPVWEWCCVGAMVLGYYCGVLLPDIDRDGSMASKAMHFYLPINHRGATHSVWAILAVLALGLALPSGPRWLLVGTAFGMLVHALADRPSTAGWVPFYPFGKWRVYKSTVMTRRWHVAFYSSFSPGSEDVFNGVVILASAAVFAFLVYLTYWTG